MGGGGFEIINYRYAFMNVNQLHFAKTSSTVYSVVKAEWLFTTEKIADFSSAKIKASKNT